MVQTPAPPFSAYAKDARVEIDAALERYTEFDADCPAVLRDAIQHSLLAPCKRLRPLLVLMAAEACGSNREAAIPAACAVEMVHTYSLIHDDLPAMDDDDLRRGRATCHAKYGEAMGILAGDALLTSAFEILGRDIRDASVAAACCVELAKAAGASGMVGGQVDDLAAEFQDAGLEQLERIHRRKTGAMFLVSLRLGALVAGADDEQLAAMNTYGAKLGLAFQIADDLLDVQGDVASMGKRTGKDSDRGKLTFPALLGVDESTRRAGQLIDEACAALTIFGPNASQLEALARYVVERNH
ncbi:MAG: polyprenyl synthetase family protein [Planctomycetaceae bacterium]|nr:polyprenyl synthetase family protein [Planctomycetales bacterium]MCB9874056.1 polyprenyl synthetase family protein [Planctomycetaceae bacterium]MCB9937690.1 polyprenyl synthetase family protein [Planctomycetaceae bacterium]HRX81619.1 polyprenyl synthetase family protein [Pirellulaceae bacterium]